MIGILLGLLFQCSECKPVSTPTPDTSCIEQWDGGNLWKPISEGDGNLVVLLKPEYPMFDYCEAKVDEGNAWLRLDYDGIANGDRQHYRGDRPGKDYRGKKLNGGVRCYKDNRMCFWPLPGPAKDRWE